MILAEDFIKRARAHPCREWLADFWLIGFCLWTGEKIGHAVETLSFKI
jgi:hypothetical protein